MSAQPVAPVIIKRKKVIAGGHHGGAWKVAYADFVTAMMAFFLLMWLLGATNEKQRKGIADYFNPSVPVNKVSGGGEGAFGGDSIFTQNTLSKNGQGTGNPAQETGGDSKGESSQDGESEKEISDMLSQLEEKLAGKAGESMVSELLLRHIVTRLTDEGLIVEVFDLPDAPLFTNGARPTDVLQDILESIAEVFRLAPNQIAVQGHVASVPIVSRENPVWQLSSDRADAVRRELFAAGIDEDRFARVTGFADRKPVTQLPLAIRNNRIEIILLRHEL